MKDVKIIHCVSRREIADEFTLARCRRAWESWQYLYTLGGVEKAHCWKMPRDARAIGDKRDLPYLKDALRFGMNRADSEEDVVFFSNDDVIFHPYTLPEIKRHIVLYEAGSMRRVDIDTTKQPTRDAVFELPPLYSPPYKFMAVGWPHLGRDAFVFTVAWLNRHWDRIPDFLLGSPCWDMCMAALIRTLKGYRLDKLADMYDNWLGCELPDGLCIHESHEAAWTQKDNIDTSPANNYNRELLNNWLRLYWPLINIHTIAKHEWPKGAIVRYLQLWDSTTWPLDFITKELLKQ
jgi:hypothetical protein